MAAIGAGGGEVFQNRRVLRSPGAAGFKKRGQKKKKRQ
jgi:hypothetical protein